MELILRTPHLPSESNMIETFLDASKVLLIWNNSVLTRKVQKWSGDPRKEWFKSDFITYKTSSTDIMIAEAVLSDNAISFYNGRHRTRWMLQQGFKAIPVCLRPESYRYAYEEGFLIRKAFDGERIF